MMTDLLHLPLLTITRHPVTIRILKMALTQARPLLLIAKLALGTQRHQPLTQPQMPVLHQLRTQTLLYLQTLPRANEEILAQVSS